MNAPDFDVEVMALDDLRADESNPRGINSASIARLYGSLDDYGLLEFPVWNKRTGELVGGHQRVEVLRQKGYTHTPVIICDLEPDEQAGANLALNAPYGFFDEEKLEAKLKKLQAKRFDLDRTGLPPYQIADILQKAPDYSKAVRELHPKTVDEILSHDARDDKKGDEDESADDLCGRCGIHDGTITLAYGSDPKAIRSVPLCDDCMEELEAWLSQRS